MTSKLGTTTPISKGHDTHSQSIISRGGSSKKIVVGRKSSLKNRVAPIVRSQVKINIPDELEDHMAQDNETPEKLKGIEDSAGDSQKL
jgi:hypothetical protein